jgi:hypothetical protein
MKVDVAPLPPPPNGGVGIVEIVKYTLTLGGGASFSPNRRNYPGSRDAPHLSPLVAEVWRDGGQQSMANHRARVADTIVPLAENFIKNPSVTDLCRHSLRLDKGDVPSGIVLISQQDCFPALGDSKAGVYGRQLLERCVQGCHLCIGIEEANCAG